MKLFMVVVMTVLGFRVVAEEPTKMELAVELVQAMDYCRVMERGFAEMQDAQIAQMKKMRGTVSDDTERDMRRTFELIREAMDCDELAADVAAIYAGLFSENELKELTAFYRSDIGRRYSELLPEISKQTMAISSTRISSMMPAIMRTMQLEKAGRDAE